MPVLRWKHGRSPSEIRDLVDKFLSRSGYLDKVKWDGQSFSASVGLGIGLNIKGQITDDELIIQKCGGLGGAAALGKIRETLQKIFPGGEVT